MRYRELAAKQRGFLLRSQLTEEEIQEARDTGFIIDTPPLCPDCLFYTKLNISDRTEMFYEWWLAAFPTIPPEQRHPMPYLAGSEALQIRGIGRIGSGDPTCIITPPELMPYANIEAYSVAGEMGFGWWLVEHYLPYHIDCPNSCGLGESTRGG